MVNSWIVRLYKASDYSKQIDVIGDFKEYHDRQLDNVIVFSGMYGLDDYIIWHIHKDIQMYDFTTVNIDLSLYVGGSTGKTFWRKQYKVLDVKYNANSGKYILFGISLDSAKLKTKLVDYQVISLTWDENRTPEQALKDVLEVNNIFKVEYMGLNKTHESSLRNFEYRMLTFDENWTVEDFINYIADQNHFEWYVRNNTLYIGNTCKAISKMNATRKFDLETDNLSSSAWFKKYSGETRPMDVMSHINKEWKCIWVKHIAGASGGVSKGCFTRRGLGTLDKQNYFKTLEGDPERGIASKLFINKPYSHYITLGSIVKDEGNQDYIDQISVQKNKELYKVNEPSDVKFDRVNEENTPIKQLKHRVSRSTPYLDAGGGMLFPSSLLEEDAEDEEGNKIKGAPPNSLIFQVKGKEESSVIGPFVYGNSEADFKRYKIPSKGKKDFRFSLPNGWTMYVDGDYGKMLIQCEKMPTWWDKFGFPYPGDDINPTGQESTYIYMRPLDTESASKEAHQHKISLNAGLGNDGEETGSKLKVMSDEGFYFITKDVNSGKEIKVEFTKDKIILTGINGSMTNKFEIDAINGLIKLDSDAGIIMEGGGHFLSHDTHTHPFPHTHSGVMPGPATSGPATPTNTQTTDDNTTTTEAE